MTADLVRATPINSRAVHDESRNQLARRRAAKRPVFDCHCQTDTAMRGRTVPLTSPRSDSGSSMLFAALENFFTEANLNALRELALRLSWIARSGFHS